MPSTRKIYQNQCDVQQISRELKDLMFFFPLPDTSTTPPRRFTRVFMNKKVETRAAFKKASSPPSVRKIPTAIKRTKNLTRKSSRSLIRSTTPEMLRNVLNESFATFLATELGRLSPSRQLKARAKLENVISQYNGH